VSALQSKWIHNAQRKIIASIASAIMVSNSLPAFAEESSLQDQLRVLQTMQTSQQKARFEKDEQDQVAKQLQYPEGKLVARGSVWLNAKDKTSQPFGYAKSTDLDPSYGGDTASLFILAVGREGPPLAARRYAITPELEFPMIFEVTTSDLLFPYTADAWSKSSNSKDSIALTAIISSSNSLSVPANNERFAFGVSDPITFAGTLTRAPARLTVENKVDGTLYNPQELALLAGVDKEIARMEGRTVSPTVTGIAAAVGGGGATGTAAAKSTAKK